MSERYAVSEKLLERALTTIPVGSQTFSKSKTQLAHGVSPYFVDHASGSRLWDVDGNEYVDFGNALASVMLGYCDPDVDNAVLAQLKNGVSFSLPHRLEMEVAELIVELIPSAEMVRFGKNGTDATSAAVRLARAYTGREHILVCGYHGWQDWYIGTTARDLGVPQGVKKLTHAFQYNDLASLKRLFNEFPNSVAAVMMEPMNLQWPEADFLQQVKDLTHQYGSILVFDETVTGCRYSKGGAQEQFGVLPDLTTLGKGIGNGHPLSVICGRQDIMMLMEEIFFSGTFGGETLSLAAAKVVLTKIRDTDVVERLNLNGGKVLQGVKDLIETHGVSNILGIGGHPSWSILTITDASAYTSWEIKTLFLQEVFKRGIFTIGTHNMSYAHDDTDITQLLNCYEEILPLIRKAVETESLFEMLEAEPLKPLFKVR